MESPPVINGSLTYMSEQVESSLRRNGKVYLQRDVKGDDDQPYGLLAEKQPVSVRNARLVPHEEKPRLQTHGFQVEQRQLTTQTDFLNAADVVSSYYEDCEKAVLQATGASSVYAFDHNIRTSDPDTQKRLKVQAALSLVHGDYTLTGAPERLAQLTRPPLLNDTYRLRCSTDKPLIDSGDKDRCKRFAVVNVWRNIKDTPVKTMPLACCDARSVNPKDFVVFEIRYPDRTGENFLLKAGNSTAPHRWFVYPEMCKHEILLLKTWDSDGDFARSNGTSPDCDHATFAFHSALETDEGRQENTKRGAVPERMSIEVRCMVLFDK